MKRVFGGLAAGAACLVLVGGEVGARGDGWIPIAGGPPFYSASVGPAPNNCVSRQYHPNQWIALCLEQSGTAGEQATFYVEAMNMPDGVGSVRVGTPESWGVQHGGSCFVRSILSSTPCVVHDDLNNYPDNTYPKDFYARLELPDGSAVTAGPITISKRWP